ncbi:WhiB family transcriptional regulator [Streptomyces sp. AP-93]|uniref:WhiB family transcriptional regulator n=1 Tax=Streptomyces sp. AP-93 TaxID=2929048 RepID=UPI0027E47C40|nr:WhiB family transcriptional regulator [Streptomyces sp. AP-93]
MSRAGGIPPLPPGWTPARPADWLDRLWAYEDLAPAPVTRRLRELGVEPDAFTEHPHCAGQTDLFFPAPGMQVMTPYEERGALRICYACPVRDWCLADDLDRAESVYDVIGVRGGMIQSARRALYRMLHRRPA